MEDTVHLSTSEKARLQNQKQIYCLLRLMNYVQKFYSTEKIDQATYNTEKTKLLQKYNKFSQITPNYKLQQFQRKYNIPHEQISWAKYLIENPIDKQPDKQAFLYAQATAAFIEVMDTINLAADNPVIGDIRAPLQKLQLILKKIYQRLGPEFTKKYSYFVRLLQNTISPKSTNETLTQSEFKEIKSNVQGMYTMMEIIMRN